MEFRTCTHDFGASGTYISRNHLGGFLEMLLPLGLAYTLTSRLKPVVKVFLGYASLVILAGIAVTVSRGTYASTALALLLFFGVLLFHRTYRLPSLVLLVVLLGAGAYFLPRSFPVQARLKADVCRGRRRMEDDMPACCSGRQPFGSGRRIPGGAWGPRITITGSVNSGRRRSSCGPAGRTMITSMPWPNGAWWARGWWPRRGCCWVWGS